MTLHQMILNCALSGLLFLLAAPAQALNAVDLDIRGASSEDLEASVRASAVTFTLLERQDVTPRDIVTIAQSDYANVVETLYAQGYYSAIVRILIDGQEAATIDPFALPSSIRTIQIIVDPGKPFTLRKTKIAPRARPRDPEGPFATGKPALATVIRDATKTALTDWQEAGYAKAAIATQDIVADHRAGQMDVDVGLDPGRRLTFGEVAVAGQSTVRAPRVRQIAGIPRGEQYHPEDVKDAAARLRRTGTFKSVQVTEAETPNSDGTLDMDITVVDRKPRRIGGGLELSTLDGATVSGYWLHRNLFGGAERLRFDGKITQLGRTDLGTDYNLALRFEKPAVYGPDTHFFALGELSHEDEPDYLQRKAGFTFGANREFSEYLVGELGFGVSFSRVTDRFVTPNTSRELLVFSLPSGVSYDRRDDPLDATNGYYINAGLTPFYDSRNSQGGAHVTLDGRAFRSIGSAPQSVLAGRVQLGITTGPDADEAPPDYLFYSGGSGTVRGHPYESLGADYGNQELGGKSFAALSAELRYAVTDTLGIVGFADAGFIGAETFENGNWHSGGGLGVRYKTPVGPLRFDVAAPLSGDTGEGVQLYIGIGQAF